MVTLRGGARGDETFTPEVQENIPHLLNEMAPRSTFFSQVIGRAIVGRYMATASLATGVYETFDFAAVPPDHPTVFEYFRGGLNRPAFDAWVGAPSNGFNRIGGSGSRSCGAGLGAGVILPQRLPAAALSSASSDGRYGHLLHDNYETPFHAPELARVSRRNLIIKDRMAVPGNAALVPCALVLAAGGFVLLPQSAESPIRFAYRPIGFTLDSCETPQRHAPETMAGGVAVFDYDNDGALDIFFTNGADIRSLKKTAPKYSNRLFKNDGKGHFTDVTAKAGLAGTGFDTGVAIGDYDNDGYEDIFVGGVHRNTLYHNNGDGTFTDVTEKAGLNRPDAEYGPLWSVGGAWVDIDNDGLLDLIVVNYLSWNIDTEPPCPSGDRLDYCHPKMYKPTPNQVYLNNGDGTFRDSSAECGVRAHPGKGMGIGVADYDLDGWMDFFVSNDKMYNSLFHNKGNGKFEEVAFPANVALRENAELISGMGVDFRDLDNDGYPDIALVALDDETFPLFRNTGKGDFTDATAPSHLATLSMPMSGYSPTIFDFDNDGWKDIFVSRGHVQSLQAAPRVSVAQPNTVFRNLGGARFAAFTAEAGLAAQPPRRHRGSAVGDLDGDGRLDVVVSALGAPAEIWMNRSPGANRWLELRLEGTKSNRDAIGARIKVVTRTGAQYNHVTTSCGYASSSAGPVHFGLGAAASADLVEIVWPSGRVQQLRNVAAGRVVRIREPLRP